MAATCEAVSTYALGLLHWYTQPCETDRSQCSGGDYSYDTCQCAANALDKSVTTFCRDGCVYSFGDNYSVARDFSVVATTTEDSLGPLATSSPTQQQQQQHLIGFANRLYKGNDYLGKIDLNFAPDVLGGRQNEPSFDGPYHAWWNDQACDIQQIWCDNNDAQTNYNFYIDCSLVSGDYNIINMCDSPPLTGQSTILELALLGPLYACWFPSYLPVTYRDSTSLPTGGGLGGDPIPGGVTGGGVGGQPVFGSGGGGDPTDGAPIFGIGIGTGDAATGSSPIGTGATATAGALPTGGGSFSDTTSEASSATIGACPSFFVTIASAMLILCLCRS